MNRIEGLHHLAITTADIKTQIEFFTDKLGMELVALYWMHGVENTFHGFLRLNDESADRAGAERRHQGTSRQRSAGPMRAIRAPTAPPAPCSMSPSGSRGEAELMAMKDRLRSKGVPVIGPRDHGFCKSIYFAGPENLALELSWSEEPINADAWIDPEVVALAGIGDDELARYKASSDFADSGGAVAQPGPDAPGPHMTNYPPGRYETILAMTDAEMLATSETEPPVRV